MAANSENSPLLPLLETLEDSSTSHTEQTDAYLSIANRLSGEDSKEFTALLGKQFSRLCKVVKAHIGNQNSELCNAALQTLGFCVFYNKIASNLSATEVQELLSSLNNIALDSSDKNSCTRALWVISKQNFSAEEVGKMVPSILSTLENVLNKDGQSVVIAYEALNVVIRLVEQTPAQMTEEAVQWAKVLIPLVVHPVARVRLRAATALELGIPLLLQKQQEVAALTEQLMSTKIIGELHKLFGSKNDTYVLKLWPLFVKILGKTLHRSGNFINSVLQLEELGFRSATPAVKKIAFIAWKSLIDNFALNPEILCSAKRLKLLMQPLSSIHVKTELLALTKVEVWWYLVMRLGAQLPMHFEQVCLPLLQSALCVDLSAPQTPQLRAANQSVTVSTPKGGAFPFGSPTTPKMSLNCSLLTSVSFPSVHLLGIEMMLHFLLGPEVVQFANKHKIVLSLEPLQHPLISSSSFFSKHATTLLNAVQDGFITIGKDAPSAVLHAVWKDMIEFVKAAMETGSKKERQGSEVLTCLLHALKNIISSDALQVEKCMILLECTVKGLPQKVLGSASYQGTPALFLIQLHFHAGILEHGVKEERFFINFETLVSYVFSGPTSPLAFSESVLYELNQGAKLLDNKELLWRMWSILINPLTEKINQTNEVNQGDALEHNFNAMNSALMLPVTHIFPMSAFPQPTMKTLMRTWSELYKTFARCAALVTTTDENVCCEELCSRILSGLGDQPVGLSVLERITQAVTVIVDCVNFSPYTTKFQPKTKAPLTPTDWAKKKRGPLGNLSSLLKLLVKLMEDFHALCSDQSLIETNASTLSPIASSILSSLSICLCHISLPSILRTVFSLLTKPVSVFYMKTKSESPKVYSSLSNKLDKLLGDVLSCLGSRYTGSYDNDLLEALSPLLGAIFLHKNKQFRMQASQFWNGSFGKAATLVYPEELKPVLNQVKLKTLLLLPGFTYTSTAEDSSGPYSDNIENSQLGTKFSGIEVKSTGKRDSLLARAEELKERGTPTKDTPTKHSQAKLKLDFSSPRSKKKILEEELSVDFTFIPPETKERVLTEHQKEVLRTKRVDIPVMYNNLDASQDTAMFAQYTQSQDNSQEKPSSLDETKENIESKEKVPGSPKTETKTNEDMPMVKDVAGVKMSAVEANNSKSLADSAVLNTSKEAPNLCNVSNSSASSDMVLGTPPQPASRRQSFITLEKFDSSGNRSFSPLSDAKFPNTKEVILVPDSQEAKESKQKSGEKVHRSKNPLQKLEIESQTVQTKPASRRGSKATRQSEDAGNKLELPEPAQKHESESSMVAGGDMDSDYVPDTQPPPLDEMAVDTDKENAAPETSMYYKENTPPESFIHTAMTDPQIPQKSSINQTALRRSSRRQSEVLDSVKTGAAIETGTPKGESNSIVGKEMDYELVPESQPPKMEEAVVDPDKENLPPEGNLDTKENTPPDDVNQTRMADPQKALSQISLRRSSRRQSEILESIKKEATIEKPSQSKEEQKQGLKALPFNETLSKPHNEKLIKTEGADDTGFAETTLENSQADEALKNVDIKDAKPSDSSQELTKGRPRYHTRRSLQTTPTGNDNSESDNSQTREVLVKRKRGRPRIIKPEQEKAESSQESQSEDTTPFNMKHSDKEPDSASDIVSEVDSQSEIDGETYTIISENFASRSKIPRLEAGENTDLGSTLEINKTYNTKIKSTVQDVELESRVEINKTYELTQMNSKVQTTDLVCTMEMGKTYNLTNTNSPMQSLMTEPTAGDFSTVVSDVFKNSETGSVLVSCPHKRSRRVRKSRGCECCCETLSNREKSFTELKSGDTECKKTIDTSSDIQFNYTFSGPCAVSTPLVLSQQQGFFKGSAGEIKSDTESEQEHTVVPLDKCKSEPEEMQVSIQEKALEVIDSSTEPSDTEETVIQRKTIVAEQNIEKECIVEPCSEEEEMVQEVEETSSCQVVDMEAHEPPTSDSVNDKFEELENAQSIIVEDNEEDKENRVFSVTGRQDFVNKPEFDVSKSSVEKVEMGVEKPAEEAGVDLDKASEEPTAAENTSTGKTGDIEKASTEESGLHEDELSVVVKHPAEEKPDEDMFCQTLAEESGLVTVEQNADNEKENVPIHQELPETCAVQSTDPLSNISTSTEGSKVNDELEAAALGIPEMAQSGLGEGHSSTDSPSKLKGLPYMVVANDSPSGSFSWSPSASPSTSILKKGLKRQQEIDSPSPINKIRRVSFADPIYQEGLADDIDRRSPVIRSNPSNNSPSSRSLKMLTSVQPKINTTPTKGFVSPGSRVLGFKSSKKSLISEMTKESMPSPKESVYPALMNCTAPIEVILPQITSNMWARGLGHVIRAKNIKTIGDLSTLTPCEIKTLPIRSPKISTVKKALRCYHDQQTKSKGFDEFAALDEAEKLLNGLDEKPASTEEKLETDVPEAPATALEAPPRTPDILSQTNALSLLINMEELMKYSGSQLFEVQEKLGNMSNCILQHLRSRWRSPPHDGSV
ncbi:telomere-associated protein RIF1 isoform X2 [Hyperolius riggenbachi]|uniref:telomere-associated protein RIF1 isoform X2 n=1 Tax=Hyperolius riggenbachi TaxID=752182 RepID=UPI0035A2F944